MTRTGLLRNVGAALLFLYLVQDSRNYPAAFGGVEKKR